MKNLLNLHFASLLGHLNSLKTELLDALKKGIETTKNLFSCRKRKTKVAAKNNEVFDEDLYFLQKIIKITKTIVENARTNIFKNLFS